MESLLPLLITCLPPVLIACLLPLLIACLRPRRSESSDLARRAHTHEGRRARALGRALIPECSFVVRGRTCHDSTPQRQSPPSAGDSEMPWRISACLRTAGIGGQYNWPQRRHRVGDGARTSPPSDLGRAGPITPGGCNTTGRPASCAGRLSPSAAGAADFQQQVQAAWREAPRRGRASLPHRFPLRHTLRRRCPAARRAVQRPRGPRARTAGAAGCPGLPYPAAVSLGLWRAESEGREGGRLRLHQCTRAPVPALPDPVPVRS